MAIITAYDGSLNFDTKIDTKGFSRGTNTIKSQANALKSTLAGLGKVMIAAFSVAAIVTFGKQAIDIASDLTEVQNVVDTAFGDMSYKIEDFAKTSIEKFGLSKLAAKQMASTYMAMSTGIGQMADQASDMAVEITGRLADVMSFYNKTQSEADTIGRALYSGETEPLKAIGLVATQTNLHLFALQQGFTKTYEKMSAGEQLYVRQLFFLDKTSLAAGDFVKTSKSWANQTRVLSENWKNFLGILGNGLIQILTPAVVYLNSALNALTQMATTAGKVLSLVFGFNNATQSTSNNLSSISSGSDDASKGITDVGNAAKATAKKIKNSTAPFDQLNTVMEATSASSSDLSDALNSGGNYNFGVTPKINKPDTTEFENSIMKLADNLKTALAPATDALKTLWNDGLSKLAGFAGTALIDFFNYFLVPVGSWALGEGIPKLILAINGLLSDIDWDRLNKALSDFWKAIAPLAIAFGQGFIDFIGEMAEALKPYIIDAVNGLADGISLIADSLDDINPDTVKGFGEFTGWVVSLALAAKGLEWLIKTVEGISKFFVEIRTFGSTITAFFGAGGGGYGFLTFMSELSKLSSSGGAYLPALVDSILLSAPDSIQKFVSGINSFFDNLYKSIGDSLSVIFNWDSTLALVDDMVEKFETAFSENQSFLDIGENIVLGILEGILSVFSAILEPINDLFLAIWNALCDVFGIHSPATEMMPIGKYILEGIVYGFSNAVQKMWDTITIFATNVITKIGSAFKGKAIDFSELLSWFKDKTVNFKVNIWNKASDIKKSWDNLAIGFKDKLVNFRAQILQKWNDLKERFHSLYDNFKNKDVEFRAKVPQLWSDLKGKYNALTKYFVGKKVEFLVSLKTSLGDIKKFVNDLIDSINTNVIAKLSIDWDMPSPIPDIKFKAPKIPRLATGTVVPRNYGDFLAVLGDNKRETEVVSPLSTIEKAVENVLNRRGSGSNQPTILKVYLEGKQIYQEVVKQNNYNTRRTGENALA